MAAQPLAKASSAADKSDRSCWFWGKRALGGSTGCLSPIARCLIETRWLVDTLARATMNSAAQQQAHDHPRSKCRASAFERVVAARALWPAAEATCSADSFGRRRAAWESFATPRRPALDRGPC